MEKLNVCLNKLEPFKSKEKEEILQDPYLQDIIERNLEVSAQSVIDIANRIISNDISKFMQQVKGWMKAKVSNEKPKD